MSKHTRIFAILLCTTIALILLASFDFAKEAAAITARESASEPETQESSSVAIIDVHLVDLMVRNFAYDKNTSTLYASVPSYSEVYSNSIVPISVPTMTIGAPIYVGSEPNRIEISDDSSTLYVGLDGEGAVRRVDLQSGIANIQFALGSDSCGTFKMDDIVIQKDNPNTVIISRRNSGCSPRHEGVVVYDNDVMRPQTTQDHTGSNQIEPSDVITKLYGYNNETSEFGFRHLSIDDQGIYEDSNTTDLLSGYGVEITYHDGLIYASSGAVIDPTTNTLVGTYAAEGKMALAPETNQVFFAQKEFNGPLSIEIFELDSFLHTTSILVPEIDERPYKLEFLLPNLLALHVYNNQLFILEITELNHQVMLPVIYNNYCASAFTDDFSDPGSGWPIQTTGASTFGYVNGEYNIHHQNEDRWLAVTNGNYWRNSEMVQIKGRVASNEGVWGLLFGLNDDWTNFFTFEILPDSQVWVVLHFSSSGGWSLVANGTSNAIIPGSAFNVLSLEGSYNNQTRFLINGSSVYNMGQRVGRVGITGGSFENNTTIRYDDYLFVDLHCPNPTEVSNYLQQEPILSLERPALKTLLTTQEKD